jgi:hypothetical protein
MDALEDGERVNTKVVGREKADSAGRFAVSLDPATLGSEHRRSDGGVQLELVVADAVDEVFWDFTAAVSTRVGSAWGNDRIDQRDLAGRSALNLGPAHVSIDVGERPEVRELGDEPETWVDDNGERLTLSSAAQRATAAKETRRALFDEDVAGAGDVTPLGQGWCATSAYKNGLTEGFIRTIGVINAKNWVDQGTSSSHTLGVGYKSGSGSWSQSGTEKKSTGATSSDHRGYNATIRNKVNYRRYVGCDGLPLNAERWRPSSIHSLGSSGIIHSTRPAWNKPANCTTYSQGNKTKSQGTNVTFSSGISFSPISLSAKSSYSSNTKQRWVVTGRFQLCGSTSSGWAGAPQAGAFVP